ncbi:hypothetical protein [Shewanella mangrovi]|nr:hypothetical protein [Shewanella mangrovi]
MHDVKQGVGDSECRYWIEQVLTGLLLAWKSFSSVIINTEAAPFS